MNGQPSRRIGLHAVQESSSIEFLSDPWLSQRLGKEAYRLVIDETTRESPGLAEEIVHRLPNGAFVQARVQNHDKVMAIALGHAGFRSIEELVTFEIEKADIAARSTTGIRWAHPADRDEVVDLARQGFIHSRFHRDPDIAPTKANEIKADWAGGFFAGARGNRMVVAEWQGNIIGFMLLIDVEDSMIIDLIAVAEQARGKGIAADMIGFSIDKEDKDIKRLRAGTQAENLPSVRLYTSMGFQPVAKQLTFHQHVNEDTCYRKGER